MAPELSHTLVVPSPVPPRRAGRSYSPPVQGQQSTRPPLRMWPKQNTTQYNSPAYTVRPWHYQAVTLKAQIIPAIRLTRGGIAATTWHANTPPRSYPSPSRSRPVLSGSYALMGPERGEGSRRQRLGEAVSRHLRRRHVVKGHFSACNTVPHHVICDIDELGARYPPS